DLRRRLSTPDSGVRASSDGRDGAGEAGPGRTPGARRVPGRAGGRAGTARAGAPRAASGRSGTGRTGAGRAGARSEAQPPVTARPLPRVVVRRGALADTPLLLEPDVDALALAIAPAVEGEEGVQ